MNNFTDNLTLSDEGMTDRERLNLMIDRSRRFVRAMLNDGAGGRELVYSLTYVATDLGLYQTDNSYHVFPRLLEGILDAAQNVIEDELKQQQQEREVIDDPASNILKMPLLPEETREA